jgi:hypothetical protein
MTPKKGYYVQIVLYRFEYSRYEGVEYDDFVRVAQATGFEVDIPRTDLLIKPTVVTVDITSPGQWALYEMIGTDISEEEAIRMLRKYDGREPCPTCVKSA